MNLSDTPAGMIARLDASLQRCGETVTVRRYAANSETDEKTDIAARAHIRGLKAEEMAGSMDQSWSKVIMSPTGLDALLPIRKGDKIVQAGNVEREVQIVEPIRVADVLVRLNLMVAG